MISFNELMLQQQQNESRNVETSIDRPVKRVENPVEDTELHNEKEEVKYKDSTKLEHEVATGGGTTSQTKEETVATPKKKSEKKATTTRSRRIRSETAQIREFPRELLNLVRGEFPKSTNNQDALAAFVYVKLGKDCDVPDSVKELARSWEGDKTIENMEKRLHNLERQTAVLAAILQEVELGLSYMLFDRFGFRKDNPKDSRSADLLEPGVTDMIFRLREQTKQYRQQESIKNGRPIR